MGINSAFFLQNPHRPGSQFIREGMRMEVNEIIHKSPLSAPEVSIRKEEAICKIPEKSAYYPALSDLIHLF
jgi:hypothetical protein